MSGYALRPVPSIMGMANSMPDPEVPPAGNGWRPNGSQLHPTDTDGVFTLVQYGYHWHLTNNNLTEIACYAVIVDVTGAEPVYGSWVPVFTSTAPSASKMDVTHQVHDPATNNVLLFGGGGSNSEGRYIALIPSPALMSVQVVGPLDLPSSFQQISAGVPAYLDESSPSAGNVQVTWNNSGALFLDDGRLWMGRGKMYAGGEVRPAWHQFSIDWSTGLMTWLGCSPTGDGTGTSQYNQDRQGAQNPWRVVASDGVVFGAADGVNPTTSYPTRWVWAGFDGTWRDLGPVAEARTALARLPDGSLVEFNHRGHRTLPTTLGGAGPWLTFQRIIDWSGTSTDPADPNSDRVFDSQVTDDGAVIVAVWRNATSLSYGHLLFSFRPGIQEVRSEATPFAVSSPHVLAKAGPYIAMNTWVQGAGGAPGTGQFWQGQFGVRRLTEPLSLDNSVFLDPSSGYAPFSSAFYGYSGAVPDGHPDNPFSLWEVSWDGGAWDSFGSWPGGVSPSHTWTHGTPGGEPHTAALRAHAANGSQSETLTVQVLVYSTPDPDPDVDGDGYVWWVEVRAGENPAVKRPLKVQPSVEEGWVVAAWFRPS